MGRAAVSECAPSILRSIIDYRSAGSTKPCLVAWKPFLRQVLTFASYVINSKGKVPLCIRSSCVIRVRMIQLAVNRCSTSRTRDSRVACPAVCGAWTREPFLLQCGLINALHYTIAGPHPADRGTWYLINRSTWVPVSYSRSSSSCTVQSTQYRSACTTRYDMFSCLSSCLSCCGFARHTRHLFVDTCACKR